MFNQYLVYGLLLFFVVVAALIIKHFKNKYDTKIVPHAVGNKTIYLQRNEIDHFESLSRTDQRKFINRFMSQVKSGRFKEVRKNGKVVGYIKN